MLPISRYLTHEMPPLLAAQVRAFVRVQWPRTADAPPTLWDFEPRDQPGLHLVITDGELLVSHLRLKRRDFTLGDQPLRVMGVSSVFTFPDRRRRGHARRLMRAASDHVLESGVDMGLLFCDLHAAGVYFACGWEALRGCRVRYGPPDSPLEYDGDLVMALSVSDRGRAARHQLLEGVVHVGPHTW